MKVKLTKALHFSEIGTEPQPKGATIDVPDGQAKSLIERGLATKAEGASKKTKAEGRSAKTK